MSPRLVLLDAVLIADVASKKKKKKTIDCNMFAQGLTFTKTSCHFWLLCETQNNLVAGRQTDSWPTFTKSGIDFVYTHMESQIG